MQSFSLGNARTGVVETATHSYQFHFFQPEGSAPGEGWPALFLLDADGCFATAVEALRRMARRPDATAVTDMVIVGLGPVGGHAPAMRQRDFTTPRSGDDPASGGAADFLRFLRSDMLPMIGRFASIDMRRLTLFGHSLAGYFALWSLFEAESPFDRVCAASPSIWWDQDHLLARLPHLAGRESHVDILMGEWEGDLPPWQAREPDADRVRARRAERDMIGTARALSAHMAAHLPPGHCSFRLLPEEDHASLVSAAIPRALRMASRP